MQHKLSIRIDLASGARIGPGKVALLEEIGRCGSISGAGRALKMSYRRAWDLVEELNRQLGASVVSTAAGGAGGGGGVSGGGGQCGGGGGGACAGAGAQVEPWRVSRC